jgi:hypothetical protein
MPFSSPPKTAVRCGPLMWTPRRAGTAAGAMAVTEEHTDDTT